MKFNAFRANRKQKYRIERKPFDKNCKNVVPGQVSKKLGFTLVEIIVTLLILSSAAAVLLHHVRVLIDYNFRSQRQQHRITDLMNQKASLAVDERYTLEDRREYVVLTPESSVYPMQSVQVENFSFDGYEVPIFEAYSPYQLYTFGETTGKQLQVLLPSLIPPGQ